MKVDNDIPRRNRLDLNTPAERAIYDAMLAVEAMPADVRLTDAVNLLEAGRDSVADFVDGIQKRRYVRADMAHGLTTPPDDMLLGWWRSVTGPKAELTGPLIRFAGLVADAVRSVPTGEALVRAVVALIESLPSDYDWNPDPFFLTLLEGAVLQMHARHQQPSGLREDRGVPGTVNAPHASESLSALIAKWRAKSARHRETFDADVNLGRATGDDVSAAVYKRCADELSALLAPSGDLRQRAEHIKAKLIACGIRTDIIKLSPLNPDSLALGEYQPLRGIASEALLVLDELLAALDPGDPR